MTSPMNPRMKSGMMSFFCKGVNRLGWSAMMMRKMMQVKSSLSMVRLMGESCCRLNLIRGKANAQQMMDVPMSRGR